MGRRGRSPARRVALLLTTLTVLAASCDATGDGSGEGGSPTDGATIAVPDDPPASGTFHGGPGRPGRTAALGVDGDGAPSTVWTIEGTDPVIASPVVADGVAIVSVGPGDLGEVDGEVVAVEAGDGTERWRVEVPDADASPLVLGDHVVVAARDGTLLALSLADGSEAWRVALDGRVRSSPLFLDGLVVVGVDDRLVARAARDGSAAWDVGLDARIDGSATAIDGTVDGDGDGAIAVGDTGNNLWLVGRDGEVLSQVDLGEVVEGTFVPGIAATPAVAGDLLVVGSTNATVVGAAVDTLAAAWTVELDGGVYASAAIAADDATAFLATDAGTVVALDVADGSITWQVEVGKAIYASPTLAGDDDPTLLVLEEGGNLVGLDPADGTERWRTPVGKDGNYMSSTPVVADGTIVVGTNTGDLVGIR